MVKLKLDHVCVVVEDLEKTIDFYVNTLGCQMSEKGVLDDRGLFPGQKFRHAFLTIGDVYIEIMEPKEGPFFTLLQEKGNGALCELYFEVDNIEEFYDKMKDQGIILRDMTLPGTPLIDKKFIVSASGNKFAYLPIEKTGTWIGVMQRVWR